MAFLKAFFTLLVSAFLFAWLILDWESLGNHYIVLTVLPDVPLLGARLGLGFFAAIVMFSGIIEFKEAREQL